MIRKSTVKSKTFWVAILYASLMTAAWGFGKATIQDTGKAWAEVGVAIFMRDRMTKIQESVDSTRSS